ncbi:hypothetical protein ACMGD3_24770 [Lysinibacillus sphaericus]|uniref:hypothetical protein n=1 Tax=Lysinibacillus sphaericus TaxID=1421 RepID=UPI003F7B1B6C
MRVDIMSLVNFVIIWGIPTFMVVRGYLKMNTDDRKSAMHDFRSRHFIFTIGFIVIGSFFAHLGTLFGVSIMKIMGIALMFLGGILSMLTIWKKSKIRSLLILVILAISIYIYVM